MDALVAMAKPAQLAAPVPNTIAETIPPPEVIEIDWMQVATLAYIIIAAVLLLKVILNFISLFRLLKKQQIQKQEQFAFVDLNENIAPFSFFNYIVFNSRMFTNEELESILNHEKVHSRERHSFDILIAKLFSIVFWFNPFVWLYKKAISQNLEYIADRKAIQESNDKRGYQIALLKVVTNQDSLSITNNFYQSLIKKRIVMLNKNQSKKRNLWKYAFILPLLVAFMFYFQVKLIAQEMNPDVHSAQSWQDFINIKIDKNSTDAELKAHTKKLKEDGITLKFSKVKRNSSGEITGIKAEFKDKEGNKGVSQVDGKEPIKPIVFYKHEDAIGFGAPKDVNIFKFKNRGNSQNEDSFAFTFDKDAPEAPEPPEAPEDFEAPEPPEAPEAPEFNFDFDFDYDTDSDSKIVIKTINEDGKPLVMVNGKVVADADMDKIMSEINANVKNNIRIIKNGKGGQFGVSSEDGVIYIDTDKLSEDAMKQADIAMFKAMPDMENAKIKMRRSKDKMKMSKADMEQSKAAMQQAKDEMEQVKAEMEKVRAEMQQLKAEQQKYAEDYKQKTKAEAQKKKQAKQKQ
ncbi:M56 family metallopeptidase [Flavobacterium sp. 3HN19-14]|uniref:M56 family metallopeptidase n=1 Tax=Flavobacterium sp. 3HN19-14 TaxID=3448133 RepID=UPI003EE05A6C